jgi:hypothetical protein
MSKIKIEYINGHSWTELEYTGKSFCEKCEEILKAPFYITMGDHKDSTLIARDKIMRIINIEP